MVKKGILLYFIFSALIILADQFVKYIILQELPLGDKITFIPGVLSITHVRNTGAAFSLLSDMRWLLISLSSLSLVFIIVIMIVYDIGVPGRIAIAAVLGGAVGNFIDRAFFGYVIDMFEFEFVRFAIFNVADCFITIGGIVFCGCYVMYSAREAKEEREEKPALVDGLPEEGQSDVQILQEDEELVPEENSDDDD